MCIFVRQRHRSTATKAPINQRHATGKRIFVGTHNLWRGLELWSGRRHRAFKVVDSSDVNTYKLFHRVVERHF